MTDSSTPERTRTISWDDPQALADAGTELAGIDYLRAMMAGELPHPPISELLGQRITAVEDRSVTFSLTPSEFHYNPIGVLHGGIAATLIDSATGCAVHTTLPAGGQYLTLNLSTDYLRPITEASGEVHCTGTVVHRGRKTGIATAEVVDSAGKVYARGQSNCLILS